MTTEPTLKLTGISQSAMDVLETSYEAGTESDANAEDVQNVTFTKTTCTGPGAWWDRVSEDFEIKAEEWRTGWHSIAHDCTQELSDSFVAAADERIAKSFDAWARKSRRLAKAYRSERDALEAKAR